MEGSMQYSVQTTKVLEIFTKGTSLLCQIADGLDTHWQPELEDPRRLHNSYIQNLVGAYVSKYAELSRAIVAALEREDYLVYALCGRALIETVANLRYYVVYQYKP